MLGAQSGAKFDAMGTLRFVAHERLRRILSALVLSSIAIAATAQPVRVPDRFRPPSSWADLVDAVAPAVVAIEAVSIERKADSADSKSDDAPAESRKNGAEVDPFEFFFGDASSGAEGKGGEKRSNSGGTGFLISRDGLVVTNFHVVDGAQELKVRLDGRHYTARVRGTDKFTDIALLQIDAGRDLPYLELADSDAGRVGDWVMAIGNPLGLDKTVTTGVVSAKGRSIGLSRDSSFENFIQTDAAINFGNSGGPLVDMQGRVLGVTTAVNYGAQGIGFAVPANMVRDILPQLRDKGRVSRGYLGFQLRDIGFDEARQLGVEGRGWLQVGNVAEGLAAHKAGIQRGDVIVSVDGRSLVTSRELTFYVANKAPGTRVTLEIVRDGGPLEKQVTLSARPESPPARAKDRTPKGEVSDN